MANRIPSPSRPELVEPKPLIQLDQRELDSPSSAREAVIFYIKNHIADWITLMRVFLGIFLLGSAFDGQASLDRDIWILVLSWSSDMIDGSISRSLNTASKTWLGKNDVYVDMFVSVAVLFYLGATGLLPLDILAVYVVIWSLLFLRWGIPAQFAQVFQNPIYAYFVYKTVQAEPSVLLWLFLWALLAAVLFWRRGLQLFQNMASAIRGKMRK